MATMAEMKQMVDKYCEESNEENFEQKADINKLLVEEEQIDLVEYLRLIHRFMLKTKKNKEEKIKKCDKKEINLPYVDKKGMSLTNLKGGWTVYVFEGTEYNNLSKVLGEVEYNVTTLALMNVKWAVEQTQEYVKKLDEDNNSDAIDKFNKLVEAKEYKKFLTQLRKYGLTHPSAERNPSLCVGIGKQRCERVRSIGYAGDNDFNGKIWGETNQKLGFIWNTVNLWCKDIDEKINVEDKEEMDEKTKNFFKLF